MSFSIRMTSFDFSTNFTPTLPSQVEKRYLSLHHSLPKSVTLHFECPL